MIKYKFSKNINKEFSKALRLNVNAYFKDNKLSRQADSGMMLKVFLVTAFYLGIFTVILFAGISNVAILFLLWMLLGAGQALIGTCVMHDVLHGSFSNKKWVNRLMQIPIALIGVEPSIWKIQHNVLHHTYTNIENADEDIASRYVLRLTENQPRKWFHSYQHWYVTFFYSLLTIIWMTAKDFIKLFKYYRAELVTKKQTAGIFLNIVFRRAVYYGLFLVLPIQMLDVSAGMVVLMFVSMLVVSGLSLSIIFQTAHVVQDCVALQEDEELIKRNWYVHQLMTTSNYAPGNKWVTYLFGALNYQVEHHLFPNISHIHYPELSKIVQATAKEYGIPYNSKPTFGAAIKNHYQHLKSLGKNDSLAVISNFTYS